MALAAGLLALAPQPSAATEARRATISVSGDVLPHASVLARAEALGGAGAPDFAALLAGVRPRISRADAAVCHLETPIDPGAPTAGEPPFNAPPALARGLAATGFDACSTASNHSLDRGAHGVRTTAAVLERAGLLSTGSFATARAHRTPLILTANGIRVAYLAYTTNTNNNALPAPYSVNVLTDPETVIADARRAHRAGADAVIVNVHWTAERLLWTPDLVLPGARSLAPEFASQPSPAQQAVAARLLRSPAVSAVVGQGPHVVQPIDWVAGKPAVYSEGNLISGRSLKALVSPLRDDGLIVELTLARRRGRVEAVRVRAIPIRVQRPSDAVVLATRETAPAIRPP